MGAERIGISHWHEINPLDRFFKIWYSEYDIISQGGHGQNALWIETYVQFYAICSAVYRVKEKLLSNYCVNTAQKPPVIFMHYK